MLEALVNQLHTMSLGEEVYTICFTAFIVGGALSCFLRPAMTRKPEAAEQPMSVPPRSSRATWHRPARVRVTPRLGAMQPPRPPRRAIA